MLQYCSRYLQKNITKGGFKNLNNHKNSGKESKTKTKLGHVRMSTNTATCHTDHFSGLILSQ